MSLSLQDHIVGLDFGTSTTRCAVYDGGRPRCVPNGAGREATPTVVSVTDSGTLLAGKPAADRTATHPERTVTDLVDRLHEGDPFVVDGVSYPPETLAAAVVSQALPSPADSTDSEPMGAVLTVPHDATAGYRRRLRAAAAVVGLPVECVILDTTGVSLAFGVDHEGDRTVLACDLGGGTFDASVMKLGGGVYEVVGTDGDRHLGGDDLDAAVVDRLADAFDDDHDIDLRTDRQARRRLMEAAADARVDLDTCDRASVFLPFVTVTEDGPLDLDTSLSRAAFESTVADTVGRIEAPIDRVLNTAGVTTSTLDDVVLAGDATRTPAVREHIEAVTDTVPTTVDDPGSAAVLGAAIQGGVLSGHIDGIILLNVLPHTLGVAVDGDGVEPILPADVTVPIENTETFTTTVDEQRSARVQVREGDPDAGGGSAVLGSVTLTELPATPAGDPRIEVTLSVDERGTVIVTAECEAGGVRVKATFSDDSYLTDAAMGWNRWLLFGERSDDLPLADADPDSPERIAAHRPGRIRNPSPGEGDAAESEVPPLTRPPRLPHTVGVETTSNGDGDGFDGLLEAGDPLPARASKTFTTATAGQESVRLRVLREEDSGTAREPIGEFTVSDLPTAPAGVPEIMVVFAVDEEGTLTVTATADGEENVIESLESAVLGNDTSSVSDEAAAGDGPVESAEFHPFDADEISTPDTGTPHRVDRSPTSDEIDCLLDVRDDLTRALNADADATDPEPVQAGLQATRKKLDRLTAGELTASVADDVLAVANDIDRAVDGDPGTVDRLRGWVRSTRRRIDGTLERSGVELVDPDPGTRLDPDRHNAVTTAKSERPRGTILEMRRVGYILDGRVERPAAVVVSDGSAARECGPPERIPQVPDRTLDYDALVRGNRVGWGGHADVHKATVEGDDLTVALKEPRFSGTLHREVGERFVDEAKTWAKIDDHDHVVGVVDWGKRPVPWIAMEYMDGGDLSDQVGELTTPRALWTAIAVTRGVYHAHRSGVVHLDLKPENVLFRSVEDGWDVPKVADWGLSRRLFERPQEADGYTPTYAAPEQFDDGDEPIDMVTDIYQLGAVFYELFTGRPPFRDDEAGDVVERIRTETPPLPSDLADIPEAVDDVLLTALATERSDRYESVLYLRDALLTVFEEQTDG